MNCAIDNVIGAVQSFRLQWSWKLQPIPRQGACSCVMKQGRRTSGVGGGHGQRQVGCEVVPQCCGGGDAHEAVHQQQRRVCELVQVGNAGPVTDQESHQQCVNGLLQTKQLNRTPLLVRCSGA